METKKSKLHAYSEEKNIEAPLKVIEPEDLPETKIMASVKSFSMPLASVQEIKNASEKYQEFIKALLTAQDLVEIETLDKKTGKKEKKIVAKKSGFGKIARFWGVSTEILRSFTEEKDVLKDKWGFNKAAGKSYLISKKGDKYLLAKAWAKAILPNGQFAVRGAAVSENERAFAHLEHDLLATAETRAVKRAVEAVVGMGEILAEEDMNEENNKTETTTKISKAPKKTDSINQKNEIATLIKSLDSELKTKLEYDAAVKSLTGIEMSPENYDEIIGRLNVIIQERKEI